MTGGALVWAFIKRFWYVAPLLALAFIVLFQRNTITGRTAERDAALKAEAQVREANRSQEETIRRMGAARIDNDKIAEAVAARIAGIKAREVHTNTVIRELKNNDPNVRAWADSPIPVGVRDAVNAPRN
jgi:hypothetical protein